MMWCRVIGLVLMMVDGFLKLIWVFVLVRLFVVDWVRVVRLMCCGVVILVGWKILMMFLISWFILWMLFM